MTDMYKTCHVKEMADDVVLSKARFYAGAEKQLEEILRTQNIDTVILSGIATSGVVLAISLQLFDLDYDVQVFVEGQHVLTEMERLVMIDTQLCYYEHDVSGGPQDEQSIDEPSNLDGDSVILTCQYHHDRAGHGGTHAKRPSSILSRGNSHEVVSENWESAEYYETKGLNASIPSHNEQFPNIHSPFIITCSALAQAH